MRREFVLSVAVMVLTGCSSQTWYEAAQEVRRQQCDTLSGTQRQNCLEGTDKSYREYEKDRRDVNSTGS